MTKKFHLYKGDFNSVSSQPEGNANNLEQTKIPEKIRRLNNKNILKEILSLIQKGKNVNGLQTSLNNSRILLFGKG